MMHRLKMFINVHFQTQDLSYMYTLHTNRDIVPLRYTSPLDTCSSEDDI